MSTDGIYKEDDASALAGELFSGKLSLSDALAKIRTRLLDLSMRNRLLNYKHPKGRSFQFVNNPDLNLLFDRLEDGRSLPLLYVPDPPVSRYEEGKKPEARIYAREEGIGTSVDFSPSTEATARNKLTGLQVLHYPEDLERWSKKISTEARIVVEETGTNMLYLMFGFLEYFDSEDSEKAIHAPLLSMPVNLVRGRIDEESRTYLYELIYSGEDIAENFTLREKLRQQFRLELPGLDEEDSPEEYFAKIQAAVSKRKNWCVKRRLSLGFLSFGKLAIWADLDPAKSEVLLSSELLRNVFEGARSNDIGTMHAKDYDIDEHEDGELPLIYDADSSQHSALIDVKRGKSLVINGPPGTGKSQTITNIIASAIAAGKKVLFVSEKLAALEVVKKRLEKVGLGDFCLELHSHKTQKKQLLESVEQRMSRQYPKPMGYESRLNLLREKRNALNLYAALLGSQTGNSLGLSVHQIFWITERNRQGFEGNLEALAGISIKEASSWQAIDLDNCRGVLSDLANALGEFDFSPKDSPWIGFNPELLIKGDELPIVRILEQALPHVREVSIAADRLTRIFGGAPWTILQLSTAAHAVEGLRKVPQDFDGPLLESLFIDGVSSIDRVENEVFRLSTQLEQIRRLRKRSVDGLVHHATVDIEKFRATAQKGKAALTEAALERTTADLVAAVLQLQEGTDKLEKLTAGRDVLLPSDVNKMLSQLTLISNEPASAAWIRMPGRDLVSAGDSAAQVARAVRARLEQVKAVLDSSNVSFTGQTEELQALLDGRGMPELLPEAVINETVLKELQRWNAGGWGDWTAERFSSVARRTGEVLLQASQAAEELKAFFGRLGIPVETSKSWIESIEAILAVMETAPKELLVLRCSNFERPDFADFATRADDTYKSLAYKASKVTADFQVENLPDEDSLRGHIQAFRRGNSLLNIFRSDWRNAKAAFRKASKSQAKVSSDVMLQKFAAVHSWKVAEREFSMHGDFKFVLGKLFRGMDTDFSKIHRLHDWIKTGAALLMTTEVGQQISLNAMPEQHVLLLADSAAKVRGWIAKLQQLSQLVSSLHGLDPALCQVQRIDELFAPLDLYARNLSTGTPILRSVVVPTGSVKRALELVMLRRRINEHDDLLRSLVQSPIQLAQAGAALGMSPSPWSYQNLSESVTKLQHNADAARAMGESISLACGAGESCQSSIQILQALALLDRTACTLLSQGDVPRIGSVSRLIAARNHQLSAALDLVELLRPLVWPGVSAREAIAVVEARIEASRLQAMLEADQNFQNLLGPHFRGEDTSEKNIEICLAWGREVAAIAKFLPSGCANRLLKVDAKETAYAVTDLLFSVDSNISSFCETIRSLEKWGTFDWNPWNQGNATAVVERLERAHANAQSLVPWSKYVAACKEAASLGLDDLVSKAVVGSISSSSLVNASEYVFFRTLSRGILLEHRELAKFSGAGHERLQREFAALDKELIALNGEMYASKVDAAKKLVPGVSSGRVGDLTEMALLQKETKKQTRHIPIRQLLRRAGRSLQELKPCFMMGPLSVAQYLEQGHLQFDLIVMDEASQLRPEDALGALARGKQLVVVGDPKQLPPTNFFGRLMEDDTEDPDAELAVVDGVESILGICEHLYQPVRTLRWHYRSQHESLIAFSNTRFYDGRLVVFPSPYQRNKRLGLNYRHVPDGIYQDRRNLPEAERVVEAIFEHMRSCPEESLGVVTLNQTQRELIEDLLDKKLRDFPGAAEYLDRHEKSGWGFFVKNLENVQGDERDVIFVSTTFGKPAEGSAVRQNFGPINRPDGWRRLNVLFTRARRRIDLFTSMQPTDVVVDEKTSQGRRALREYLEFAQTGLLPSLKGEVTERTADSDFEIAVSQALRGRGFLTEAQVGVAGYFIDLGVRHPERQGEFLAGVECDGVTYHSSLSARDRDRIRQEVLESLGWRGRIIRVWSTDWFADPIGQTNRLVHFLESRLSEEARQPAPFSDEELAKTHSSVEPFVTLESIPEVDGEL